MPLAGFGHTDPYHRLQRIFIAMSGSQNCRLAARYLDEFRLLHYTGIQVMHLKPLFAYPIPLAPPLADQQVASR